jgi:hypothetical protein
MPGRRLGPLGFRVGLGLVGIVPLLSVMLTMSCGYINGNGSKRTLQVSPAIPAAEGSLKITEEENGNQKLKVEVHHLATPEKVAQGATTYVVWIRTNDGRTQNIGALQVGEDLKGTLETIVPYRVFDLFITPEPSPTVKNPSGERLMTTSMRG